MDQQEPEVASFQKLPDQGSFTLRSMYEQCQNILNLRMLSGLISAELMMPFHGHEKEEGHAKMKRYMTMMDSMTDEVLDSANPKLMMNESRIVEIARGSGRDIREVIEMFKEYEQIAKIWSKMKRLKIPKSGDMDMNDAAA